jgi:putative salt-induced outer membrane protein YdiY
MLMLAAPLGAGDPVAERLLSDPPPLLGAAAVAPEVEAWTEVFNEMLRLPADAPAILALPDDVKPETVPEPAPAAPPEPTEEQIQQAQAELEQAAWIQAELENPWGFQTLNRRLWRSVGNHFYAWTKRLTAGARYLSGNSDEVMVNVQADLERKFEWVTTQIQAGGNFGKSNGVRGTNRWFANSTNDFNTGDHWIWFLKHTDEYDEFQNLDYRGTLSGGIGYRFWNEDRKRLIVRVGPSGLYENFRDPDNERIAFDLFGELESRWPLAKRVQFEHKTTAYPNVEEFDRVRVNANASIIVSLDERDCWNLQLGVQDQYLSHPNPGRVPHDVWTSLSILYQRK